ncbi:MAG: hypothetical protein M3O80_06615 [Chloroflexota bacterium]|nr:hypothetical protein [Chloroflexota bacterium]
MLYLWGADDGIYRYDGATGALGRVWGASTLAGETADGPNVLGRHGGLTLLRWDGTTEPKCPSGSFATISSRGTCAFTGEGGDRAVYVDRGIGGAQMLLPADWGAGSYAWSPDGLELVIVRSEPRAGPVPALEPSSRNTLWHLDPLGALTKIFDSSNALSFLYGLKWSFDGRVAFWELATTSNSLAADGAATTLHVVDVHTRAKVDLGTTLGSRAWAQWSFDGRLAFVSGGGRETWGNKQVVVLERDGTRRAVAGDLGRIGGSASAAIAPAWQPSFGTPARLAWIEGPAGDIAASPDYFRAVGPIAQRIAVLETLGGRSRLTCPGLMTEGVRWSADANAALLLCRAPGVYQHALQVWYAPLGGTPRALVTGLRRSRIWLLRTTAQPVRHRRVVARRPLEAHRT